MEGIQLRRVEHGDALLEKAGVLRNEVLVLPFGLSPLDWFDEDASSVHFLAVEAVEGRDEAIGYARLVLEGREARIRQVAVAEHRRGRGLGSALVKSAIARARELRLERVWLASRTPAIRFYERLGFRVISGVYDEDVTGLPHVLMELPLQ